MVTKVDEGRGIVKTYWADIRERIAKVEPTFAKLVDELNPDKTFPLYLVYLPYGDLKGDTVSSFIPNPDGTYYRLSDPDAPKDIQKDLWYGKESSPLGMVLDKQLEYFIDLKSQGITIPWTIYPQGTFFPLTRMLPNKNYRIYSPNGILSVSSGARSTFLLANIGCVSNHINLQRDFNVQSPPAKSLYEHWNIFKEIIKSGVVECDWKSCLIYFSEKWINKIHNDEAWLKIRMYLYEKAWQYSEFFRNQVYYDIIFSIIQNQRNLKPNPYLADTAKHLFTIAIGAACGHIPAVNNDFLPLDLLQKVFVESYGLKKYFPTIMQPAYFNFEENSEPVYYSLQNPSTKVFSPKSRKISSTLYEMRELEHIVKIFTEELANDKGTCRDTIMYKVAKNIEFNYFHNEADRHHIVKPSIDLEQLDDRFRFTIAHQKSLDTKFASDAPFLRGAIGLFLKKNP